MLLNSLGSVRVLTGQASTVVARPVGLSSMFCRYRLKKRDDKTDIFYKHDAMPEPWQYRRRELPWDTVKPIDKTQIVNIWALPEPPKPDNPYAIRGKRALQQICANRGLSTDGFKEELVKRLVEHDKETNGEVLRKEEEEAKAKIKPHRFIKPDPNAPVKLEVQLSGLWAGMFNERELWRFMGKYKIYPVACEIRGGVAFFLMKDKNDVDRALLLDKHRLLDSTMKVRIRVSERTINSLERRFVSSKIEPIKQEDYKYEHETVVYKSPFDGDFKEDTQKAGAALLKEFGK